jgi:hypothetical protein
VGPAKILSHLERAAPQHYPIELPPGARAPPVQAGGFGTVVTRCLGLRAVGFAGQGSWAVRRVEHEARLREHGSRDWAV